MQKKVWWTCLYEFRKSVFFLFNCIFFLCRRSGWDRKHSRFCGWVKKIWVYVKMFDILMKLSFYNMLLETTLLIIKKESWHLNSKSVEIIRKMEYLKCKKKGKIMRSKSDTSYHGAFFSQQILNIVEQFNIALLNEFKYNEHTIWFRNFIYFFVPNRTSLNFPMNFIVQNLN